MTTKLITSLAFAAATMLTATTASATIFTVDYHEAGVWNAYDSQNQTYSMKFKDDGSKDGFWLVVSSGMNPKTNVNEYAVLYGDRAANRITAYNYNGENNPDSYKDGELLGVFENAFTDGGQHARYGYDMTMFSIDVAGVNGAFGGDEWDGVQLGEQAGIWFHQTAGTDVSYNADGSIASFDYDSQMWLDAAFTDTRSRDRSICDRGGVYFCGTATAASSLGGNAGGGTGGTGGGTGGGAGGGASAGAGAVPAPGGLALILMGLAGLGFGMRRKS